MTDGDDLKIQFAIIMLCYFMTSIYLGLFKFQLPFLITRKLYFTCAVPVTRYLVMSIDWRGTASSLSELADKFYSQPGKLFYSDVTFVLNDGSEVQAHKLILTWVSPVFEMEFYGREWVEHGRERLEIVDDRGSSDISSVMFTVRIMI